MANMSLNKTPMPERAPEVRAKDFLEVTEGYSEVMAVEEADRCLNCKNMPCVAGCPVNIEIPDFPSVILTSFAADSRNDNTVIHALILDRNIMTNDVDGPEYSQFIMTIDNLITVFKKRMELNVEEYQTLISRRKNYNDLTPVEEQRLISLYKLLYSYDLIDEINPSLLTPALSDKLDKVLNSIKKLTEGH